MVTAFSGGKISDCSIRNVFVVNKDNLATHAVIKEMQKSGPNLYYDSQFDGTWIVKEGCMPFREFREGC